MAELAELFDEKKPIAQMSAMRIKDIFISLLPIGRWFLCREQ
jgi:hypothetical protein